MALFSAVAVLAAPACEKVPLLAPFGSVITLTAPVTVLSANGSTTIIAQVIEAAGTPPHSGTHVTFATNLGRVVPAEVETDSSGRAFATFFPGGANGQASITAISGGASVTAENALKIAVGTAAVGSVSLSANPSSVSSNGGSTTVAARVVDTNGNALTGSPVAFTTTAGTLSSLLVTTDANGVATTVLTTSLQATVTASIGAASSGGSGDTPTGSNTATITVNVNNGPTISITPPATVTKGVPATFTFTPAVGATNGLAIRNVTINWGDGGSDVSLGSISSASQQTHRYENDGTFRISATVVDVAGATGTASTSISVLPLAQPTVTINVSPLPALVNQSLTVTVTITPPTGIGIRSATADYGDGNGQQSIGASSSQVVSYATTGVKTIRVVVLDTADQQTTFTRTIQVN